MSELQNKGETSEPQRNPDGTLAKGNTANPGGRPKVPAEVRAMLRADRVELYEKAKRLARKCEKAGDFKTAAYLLLGLLKKSLPDTSTLEIGGPEGGPIALANIDLKRLSKEDLETLRGVLGRARSAPVP